VPVGTSRLTLFAENTGNVAMPLAAVTTSENGEVQLSLTKPPVIEPGASVEIGASVVVDDELDPHRRHEFDLPVGTADVIVVVLPRTDRRKSSADRK
jgi:hypothetical protein